MTATSRGHDAERKLVRWYRERGYFAMRSPASLGTVDVVALKAREQTEFVEVKTTLRPFHNFSPAERLELMRAAELAGARPLLCHWPPGQKEPRFLPPLEWPGHTT